MGFGTKSATRVFQFNIELIQEIAVIVEDVLDQMETTTIGVYRPDDECAFDYTLDDKGQQILHASANLTVDLKEWLCVACQRIRAADEEDALLGRPPEVLAWYSTNAPEVLFPPEALRRPVGPAGLKGEIVLSHRALGLLRADVEAGLDKFQFVVAHELVHAFDAVRLIAPAFMDWDAYWNIAMTRGCASDITCEVFHLSPLCLDNYGQASELAMVQQYWPSQAERWFTAVRGELPSES